MLSQPGRGARTAVCVALAAAVVTGVLAACSSSPGTASPAASGSPGTAAPALNPSAAAGVITVLVTDDAGVKAPGIDALVQALRKVPGVTVRVVAPASDQSGTGGKTTSGPVTFANSTTASGYAAVAVNGSPADSADVAFSKLHLAPNVMIAGINAQQNLGPLVNVSGSVGAARVAARRGVPALAVSSGAGKAADFAQAASYAVKWLSSVRSSLPAGPSAAAATVMSLNVPNCSKGHVRGQLTLPVQTQFLAGQSPLGIPNCLSTARPATEVAAFAAGFATLVAVPVTPAS